MSTRSKVFSILALITMLIAACDRKPAGEQQIGTGIDTFMNGGAQPTQVCPGIIC